MSTNNFRVYGGTLPGPVSRKRDKPNQDRYGFTVLDESAVIAVADGAGSLARSDEGAELAVSTVIEHTPEEGVEQAVEEARKALIEHEARHQIGCTLATAQVTNESVDVSITGDAFAVVWFGGDTFEIVENPQQSEYANLTSLLTSSYTDTTLYQFGAEVQGVAVSTDGLLHYTVDRGSRTPTSGFWRPVFQQAFDGVLNVESLLQFMANLGKHDDDTAMVVAVKS